MKIKRKLLAIIGCALMITACKNQSQLSDVTIDDDVVDIKDIIVDEDIIEEEIETKTCEEITQGELGGSLTDLLVGSYIEPQCSYNCSFKHEKTFDGAYTVKSDDRAIAQVEKTGDGSFVVKGIFPGDAIIQAVTSEGDIVLQFVVHVRNRIPMDKIAEKLYSIDKYYGMFYGYKLSFIEQDPLRGILIGSDDFESTYVNFNLIDGVEERIGNGTDFNTYKFKISVDTAASQTNRTYTDIYVSTTGDKIYMYYSNGLIDIFTGYNINIYSGSWN